MSFDTCEGFIAYAERGSARAHVAFFTLQEFTTASGDVEMRRMNATQLSFSRKEQDSALRRVPGVPSRSWTGDVSLAPKLIAEGKNVYRPGVFRRRQRIGEGVALATLS